MNSKRFLLGLLSSLLLSVGLARAASSIDPLAKGSHSTSALHSMAPDSDGNTGGIKGIQNTWPPA